MKILLDPQIFNDQKFGGISRYFAEINVALGNNKSVKIDFPMAYSENLHLKETYYFKNSFPVNLMLGLMKMPLLRKKIAKKLKKRNIKETQKSLKKQDFDLFVPTYYNTYFLKDIGTKPFVLTVYDMIHEVLPQYFTRDKFTVANKKILMEKATRIIAISESTKNDILKIYPHIEASKIDIVYLSHSIKTDSVKSLSLPGKYILFVGNRADYKNFTFFLNAVAPLLKDDPDLFLVCAGGNKFIEKEQKQIADLGLSKQLIQQNFEDDELASYYTNAKCFVFPSEYEGFGIPVLESMACGCPVVLAQHSSFPEVAGDAGIYFTLNDAEDLRNKVQMLLQNETVRNDYKQKSLQQAAKFSWAKTAEDCLKVYEKAV